MADTLSRFVPVYQYIFSFEVCEPSLTGSETDFSKFRIQHDLPGSNP